MVGVRAMDDQHALLLDAANDLRLAWMSGSGHAEVRERLRRLLEEAARRAQARDDASLQWTRSVRSARAPGAF